VASGCELHNRAPFKLMKGRLGVYNRLPGVEGTNVEGIAEQHARFQ
jgi:hypothetical protein